MQLTGLYSVVLYVQDLERSLDFYQSRLGLALLTRDTAAVVLRAGSCNVVLHRADRVDWPDPTLSLKPGGHTLTFEVDNPDEWAYGLSRQGVQTLEGPIDQIWGRVVFVRDPNGRPIGLVRPTARGQRSSPQ